MLGPNSILEKTMRADGALTEYRLVKKGTAEDDAAQGALATDKLIGVSQFTAADNIPVNVMVMGISKVEYGGAITQGDKLTSDASGRAIATTTAANQVIGVAMGDGVVGDIGTVLLSQGII